MPVPGMPPPPCKVPFPANPIPENYKLETEIISIAEYKLGLLNASYLLQKEIHPDAIQGEYRREILVFGSPYTEKPVVGCNLYREEKHNSREMIIEISYLIGLERALKILKMAAADRRRENVTYSLKVVQPPAPPPPPSWPPHLVPPLGPVPPSPVTKPDTAKEIREATKSIVKETLDEYKKEISFGVEELQKEMIKLCRDVSIHAMNKN
jgi:hypothetical protein